MYPAIGASAANTQVSLVTNHYDTSGTVTGFSQSTQTFQNGVSSTPVLSVAYYTSYDSHNNPIAGYIVGANSLTPTTIIQTYTYDANGKRTQRVRTYYDSNNTVTQIQTTNYDVNNRNAYTSEIRVRGTVTTTTTFTYSPYDPNGFPSIASTVTNQVDSSNANNNGTWTGNAMFEYEPYFPTAVTSNGPLINATVLTFPVGSPLGWTSQVQVYTNNTQSIPVTDATVTVNGVALTYDAGNQQYTGSPVIALGGNVVLSVTTGGKTYTAQGKQYTAYPAISSPSPGATWSTANLNTISWSGGSPTAGAAYIVGLLDGTGQIAYPIPSGNGGGPAEVSVATTSFAIPAGSGITPGSYTALVGIGTPGLGNEAVGTGIQVPGAATGSGLWIGAINGSPVTMQ